jgi:hypothetical protein
VTPSADLDLAVADVVKSAFGNAGQKCSAASLVILVGSVGTSERFRRQLADAVTSMAVGYPQDPATQMGPIVEAVQGKLERGLTQLAEGEEWLVQPRRLDDTGKLWSPGVRDGVQPGSEFHLTEYFGPVLGIMTAKNRCACEHDRPLESADDGRSRGAAEQQRRDASRAREHQAEDAELAVVDGGDAGQHAAEERRHHHDSGEDERLVGRRALYARDGVVPGADQQQPHERTGESADDAALLTYGAREVPCDDRLHGSERAHAVPPVVIEDAPARPAACVRRK